MRLLNLPVIRYLLYEAGFGGSEIRVVPAAITYYGTPSKKEKKAS